MLQSGWYKVSTTAIEEVSYSLNSPARAGDLGGVWSQIQNLNLLPEQYKSNYGGIGGYGEPGGWWDAVNRYNVPTQIVHLGTSFTRMLHPVLDGFWEIKSSGETYFTATAVRVIEVTHKITEVIPAHQLSTFPLEEKFSFSNYAFQYWPDRIYWGSPSTPTLTQSSISVQQWGWIRGEVDDSYGVTGNSLDEIFDDGNGGRTLTPEDRAIIDYFDDALALISEHQSAILGLEAELDFLKTSLDSLTDDLSFSERAELLAAIAFGAKTGVDLAALTGNLAAKLISGASDVLIGLANADLASLGHQGFLLVAEAISRRVGLKFDSFDAMHTTFAITSDSINYIDNSVRISKNVASTKSLVEFYQNRFQEVQTSLNEERDRLNNVRDYIESGLKLQYTGGQLRSEVMGLQATSIQDSPDLSIGKFAIVDRSSEFGIQLDELKLGSTIEEVFFALSAGNDIIDLNNHYSSNVFGGDGVDTIFYRGKTSDFKMVSATGTEIVILLRNGERIYAEGIELLRSENGSFDFGKSDFGQWLISGGLAADYPLGTDGHDEILGFLGNDSLLGGAGNDMLNGGAGNDSLDGGAGNDTLTGGVGNDTYYVNSSSDVIVEVAGEGTDRLYSTVNFTLASGVSVERLYVNNQNGRKLTGNELDNSLFGGNGADRLNGGAGNDAITGGLGRDVFTGGAGTDVFIFRSQGDVDIVSDFNRDRLRFDASAYEGMSALRLGKLSEADFTTGPAMGTAGQFIWDRPIGKLYFDADGAGVQNAYLVAELQDNASLASGWITLI